MAKAPRAGQVKTRLCPPFTPEQAASLYRCFLTDLGRRLGTLPGLDVRLFHAPAGAGPELAELLGVPCTPHPQRGAGLGARMADAFARVLSDAPAAIMIGTDLPDLPLGHLADAARLLAEGADVVLGPDRDGGYYLIGMRVPFAEVFDLPMSTDSLIEATRRVLAAAGLVVAELPVWGDVDDVDDLRALRDRLACHGDRGHWATWAALTGPAGRLLGDP